MAANGTYVNPQMFAIDWLQAVHGSLFRGNGKRLSDWFGFGQPVYAVANGVVVRAISNRPETVPFTPGPAAVQKPGDYGGNEVIERIGPGLYAVYEHLKTGSVLVRLGQHLRTGQPIARLGSSGNSTGPHLHFGIQSGPDILAFPSVPFEIDHYTVREASPGPNPRPRHHHRAAPPGTAIGTAEPLGGDVHQPGRVSSRMTPRPIRPLDVCGPWRA